MTSITVQERLVAQKWADQHDILGAHGKWKVYDREALRRLPPPTWVVGSGPRGGGDSILTDGLALMYGVTGSGKSCVAIEWSCFMAAGVEKWRGNRVRPGPVLYYATEAARGMADRMDACRDFRNIHQGDYPLVVDASGLRLDAPDHIDAMRQDVQCVRPSMVVLDTLANSLGDWSENSANEMTMALNALMSASNSIDVPPATLVVHHSGHDTTRMRGSSAIKARLDTVVRVEVASEDPDGSARLRVQNEKQREARLFKTLRCHRQAHGAGVVLQWL